MLRENEQPFLVLLVLLLPSYSHASCPGGISCPVFSQETYQVSINETDETQPTPSDAVILLRVQCSTSIEMNLTYSLLKQDGEAFTIDSTTGDISAKVALDYERVSKHTLTSMCAVTNNTKLYSTARVTIHLLPMNEHRPVISNSVLQLMDCTTPLGSLDFLLPGMAYNISDSDRPKEQIYYSFEGKTYNDTFLFNLTTGSFNLLKHISDGIRFIQFTFRITVCDVSPPLLTCPNHVMLVTYTSLNTHDPEFSRTNYSISVPESVPANTTLLTVNCTDEDVCSGSYGGMQLVNNAVTDGIFSLDQDGNIRNLELLDFEDTQAYNLQVRCYDEPQAQDVQRYAFSTVTILVLDANDNPPMCSRSTLVAILRVGTYHQHKLLHISCEDEDQGTNSRLTYAVQGGLPKIATGQFNLHPTTGMLTFTGEVFPTSNKHYEINVMVSDSGDTPLTAMVKITINIIEKKGAEFPMLAVIVICIVGGLLLLCCACIPLICLYCLARHRRIKISKSLVTHVEDALDHTVHNIYGDMGEVNLHYDGVSITSSLGDNESVFQNVVCNTMVTVLGYPDISSTATLDQQQEEDRQASSQQ